MKECGTDCKSLDAHTNRIIGSENRFAKNRESPEFLTGLHRTEWMSHGI